MVEDAYVAVGSNIEPQDNIPRALLILKTHVIISAISNFYKTSPVGPRFFLAKTKRWGQADFINGVVKIQTDRSPRKLKFDVLRKIEEALGRVRSEDKYAPRTIDLDMILYGEKVIDEPDLSAPDPSIRLYPFVAVPLLELAPELILPDTEIPLADEPIVKLKSDLHLQREFTDRLCRLILA